MFDVERPPSHMLLSSTNGGINSACAHPISSSTISAHAEVSAFLWTSRLVLASSALLGLFGTPWPCRHSSFAALPALLVHGLVGTTRSTFFQHDSFLALSRSLSLVFSAPLALGLSALLNLLDTRWTSQHSQTFY
jgi:hypothetical protein